MTTKDLQAQEARTELAKILRGAWAYRCWIDSNSLPFEGGEYGRGGVILSKATVGEKQIDVELVALRMWITAEDSESKTIEPAPWVARGHVPYDSTDGEKLFFTYSSDDAGSGGDTRDRFTLPDDLQAIYPGTFVHTRPDGQLTEGNVWLAKLSAPYKLDWHPDKIEAPVTLLVSTLGEQLASELPTTTVEKHHGELYLVDTLSGEMQFTTRDGKLTDAEAFKKKNPDAKLYLGRIGYNYVINVGPVLAF